MHGSLTRPWKTAMALSVAIAGAAGCVTDGEAPESPPVEHEPPATTTPTRLLAERANDYLVHYDSWTPSDLELARRHDLVILDTDATGVDRSLVADLQAAGVIVLCYVSVGEDRRTASLTDAEMAADPRFVGDGSGPRVDPRGPGAGGEPLSGVDPLGEPSPGGTGWASFYLDDVSVHNDPENLGDGIPDRNGNFNSYFVNAGDPAWFDALQDMTIDSGGVSGLRELLTTSYGRGFGCDGVFMDTFDTAAPNGWTDSSSSNETKFEWTAPGFASFVHRLRAAYPDAVLLQNRAHFFFNPETVQYPFNPGGSIDFVFFESYRLNSGDTDNPDPYFYPDNRFNVTPKLMAEAGRSSGFQVLSLGYAEGPDDQMSEETLIGQSTLGRESLLEDIRVSERLAGYRHYLTNGSVSLVNSFVLDNAERSDSEPPRWTSTYNDRDPGYPSIPQQPTPRVGIQAVDAGDGQLTVRWDIALDLNRVRYYLYYQTAPFDFSSASPLSQAVRVELPHDRGDGYEDGVGPDVYAHQATITNLDPNATYYLLIRAEDDSPARNRDDNTVVLTASPDGSGGSYLGRWLAKNGIDDVTYSFEYAGDWWWRRVYIDRDRSSGTGYLLGNMGADFLIENGWLYQHDGTGSDWGWEFVKAVDIAVEAQGANTRVEWNLAQSDIGASYRHTVIRFELERPGDLQASSDFEHVYTTSEPSSPYWGYYAANDDERIYYGLESDTAHDWRHVFIDSDGDSETGYLIGGIGAEYLIENDYLFAHQGTGWSWEYRASTPMQVDGTSHRWEVPRSAVAAAEGAPVHRLVFQSNGGSPSFLAPVYVHRFSP